MDENTEITLKLTIKDINVILGTLSEAPYRIAQPMIAAIQQQAQAQFAMDSGPSEVSEVSEVAQVVTQDEAEG